ncbi:MAG TPA: NADH-quinone oxidoreductase subunit J [Geobacteraceae bacterium]|nr:NADH-quinone oxidoreductase subunit J [Geobacteraceae bacterium]
MEQLFFYILAGVVVIATGLAITARHTVHAIIYLATSFFGLAGIFYLLGAPLVAVFEVIIYAGAIMVLFLFVIMMLDTGDSAKALGPTLKEWWPALLLGVVILGAMACLFAGRLPENLSGWSYTNARLFSRALFQRYGVAVEVVSMQLLFALVGALYLGRRK